MFYHVVLMRFTDEADTAFFSRVEAYCTRVRQEVAGLIAFDFARNVADRSKGLDHVIMGVFETSEDHDAYQVAPVHQEMRAYMLPFIDEILVCDSDIAPAPIGVGAEKR